MHQFSPSEQPRDDLERVASLLENPQSFTRLFELSQLCRVPTSKIGELVDWFKSCNRLPELENILALQEPDSFSPIALKRTMRPDLWRWLRAFDSLTLSKCANPKELWQKVPPEGISLAEGIVVHAINCLASGDLLAKSGSEGATILDIKKIFLVLASEPTHSLSPLFFRSVILIDLLMKKGERVSSCLVYFHPLRLTPESQMGKTGPLSEQLPHLFPLSREFIKSETFEIFASGSFSELEDFAPGDLSESDLVQILTPYIPLEDQYDSELARKELFSFLRGCYQGDLNALSCYCSSRSLNLSDFQDALEFARIVDSHSFQLSNRRHWRGGDLGLLFVFTDKLYIRDGIQWASSTREGHVRKGIDSYRKYLKKHGREEFNLEKYLRIALSDKIGAIADPSERRETQSALSRLSSTQVIELVTSGLISVLSLNAEKDVELTDLFCHECVRLFTEAQKSDNYRHFIDTAQSLLRYGAVFESFKEIPPASQLRYVNDFMESLAPIPAPHTFFSYLYLRAREDHEITAPTTTPSELSHLRFQEEGKQVTRHSLFLFSTLALEKYTDQLKPGGKHESMTTQDFVSLWRSWVTTDVDYCSKYGAHLADFHPIRLEAYLFATGSFGALFLPTQRVEQAATCPAFLEPLLPLSGMYNYLETLILIDQMRSTAPLSDFIKHDLMTMERNVSTERFLQFTPSDHVKYYKLFQMQRSPSRIDIELKRKAENLSISQRGRLLNRIGEVITTLEEGSHSQPNEIVDQARIEIHSGIRERLRMSHNFVQLYPRSEKAKQVFERWQTIERANIGERGAISILSFLEENPEVGGIPSASRSIALTCAAAVRDQLPERTLERLRKANSLESQVLFLYSTLTEIEANLKYVQGIRNPRKLLNKFLRKSVIQDALKLLNSETTYLETEPPVRLRMDISLGPELALSGFISDTCSTRVEDPKEECPSFEFMTFVDQDADGRAPKVLGGTGLILTQSGDGEDVVLIRGFNPARRLLHQVLASDLFESCVDRVLVPFSRVVGAKKIICPDERLDLATLTNLGPIAAHVLERYGHTSIPYKSTPTDTFNSYSLQGPCLLIRDLS